MKLSQILRAFNFSLPVLSFCPRVLNRRTFYVLETLQFHLYSWLQLANSNQNGLYLFLRVNYIFPNKLLLQLYLTPKLLKCNTQIFKNTNILLSILQLILTKFSIGRPTYPY